MQCVEPKCKEDAVCDACHRCQKHHDEAADNSVVNKAQLTKLKFDYLFYGMMIALVVAIFAILLEPYFFNNAINQ